MPELSYVELIGVALGSLGVAVLLLALWIRSAITGRGQRQRLAKIISLEEEERRVNAKCERLMAKAQGDARDEQTRLTQLKSDYDAARATYDRLKAEVATLEEQLEDIAVGLYCPHFHFDDPEDYKAAIEHVRADMKAAVKGGRAAVCKVQWSVGNSQKDGERMQKQYLKLMLRAFNGECDAAIANVDWNNVTKMEARIEKAHSLVNDTGTVMQMEVTREYLELRLKELRLVHEHAQKKREQLEEQRQIREQMREEERVQRELDRAQAAAEAEEQRFQRALTKAREEAAKAKGAEVGELAEKVRLLEQQLEAAHTQRERAISRAQQTKSGHVYVISNVGSFGEDVFKIGMTRRLDPLDRVKELGDASVPFEFDIHAMIYSEDAPGLEATLHRQLAGDRVNLVNERKEFFRVDLQRLSGIAQSLGLTAELTLVAEAREYKETLALRRPPEATPATAAPEFPPNL
jgi:predicted nuclease with TOPRIM domain